VQHQSTNSFYASVRVNTQRLEEIQNLKAEKDGLQAIILEERAEKAALASELKLLKQELAQVRSSVSIIGHKVEDDTYADD
jgi:hypothetical protein